MESDHFVKWDYPSQEGRPEHLSLPEAGGGQTYLNLPDSPGYLQTIGDRTSLPGSPRHTSQGPPSPQGYMEQYQQGQSQHYEQEREVRRRDDLVRLSQAKVVLLGSVAAGKTSLLNALRYGESRLADEGPDGRTIGIEVHSVALRPDTKLWFYDFGGHDTYHFSQQLFLTQRAIYLLAVDISIYDPVAFEKVLRHWYTILTTRLVSPVICLLATHIDECYDKEAMARNCQDMHDKLRHMEDAHRKTLEAELQSLKKEIMSDSSEEVDSIRKFQPRTLRQPMQRLNLLLTNRPKVFRSVCCISSKTLEGMQEFRENLVSIVTDNESLFPQKDVPGSWIELSDAIVSKKEDVPFVTMAEFMELAQQFSIVGDHVQKVLAYLQSVGLVLHYQDYRQNSDLSKYVFVNPNLLLAIFGLVFNHNYFMDETRFVWKHQSILRLPHFDFVHLRKNLKERGIIGEKLLKCFWDAMGISDEVYQAIVPLLEKFDLCYEIRIKPGDTVVEGRHFLFPYLMNKRKPPEVNFMWSDDLLENFIQCGVELSFTQPTLPFGFLEKVLIRAHTYVDHCLSWKHGMVAFCDEGQDLVRIDTKPDSNGNALLTISARVRMDRKSMARHIILLLVAVTNRVLLHHYPGVVAYWYCQCAHCLVKSLEQKYSEVKVDRFPADNIVYTSPGDTTPVQCVNCGPREALRIEDVFPRETEDIHSLRRLMSEPCCRALKASAPALVKHMNYRDVMNALLRKQLLTIKQAESIGSKASHEERAQQLLIYLTHCDQKAFEVLCDELKQDGETAWLAEELRVRAAGRNAKAQDSDSVSSSFLRGASQGWRGSQGSQGSAGSASISNWSTYSRSSYGSTGSYIRRPYGSYITREPVQSYRRSASAASTPQQPRKDPVVTTAPPPPAQQRKQEEHTAGLTTRVDYVRKPAETQGSVEAVRKPQPVKTDHHHLQHQREDWKRLSNINEFPAEQPTDSSQQVHMNNKPSDPVPPAVYEVEVATTAYVQSATPQYQTNQDPNRYTRDVKPQTPAYATSVDSYVVPESRDPQKVIERERLSHQRMDDETDRAVVSEPMRSELQNRNDMTKNKPKPVVSYETEVDQPIASAPTQRIMREEASPSHTEPIGPPVSYQTDIDPSRVLHNEPKQYRREDASPKHAEPSEYETDIDAYIIPDAKQDEYMNNNKRNLQQRQHPSPPPQPQPQQQPYDRPQSRTENRDFPSQPPQQQQHQQQQPQDRPHSRTEHRDLPRENNFPTKRDSVPMMVDQREQLPRHTDPYLQEPLADVTADARADVRAPERSAPGADGELERQPQPFRGQEQREEPEPFVYKETDLDGPPERQQIPRDERAKSTGDISHQGQRVPPGYPMEEGRGGMPSRYPGAFRMAPGRGRPKSKSVVDLIGNADLGPTHVLQDMDPIELPVRPIKRSRSGSLRRPKNKSPSPLQAPEDRHTWAVPYDWEQHNSCESLNRGDTKRRSGGFVFAASAVDVRSASSGPKRPSSGPPKFSSQPTLIPEDGAYSLPRPTGRKAGTLEKYEYIEPIPMPPVEQLEASQSAPIHRRQILPNMGKPPLPPQNAPRTHPQSAQHPDQRQMPADGQLPPGVRQQGHQYPNQPMNRQQAEMQHQSQRLMAQKPFSSRLSDSSDATESYHTGRSRIGSDESDDATITSNISELTLESYRTTRSNNPSIASRALSQGSYMSAADSFHTGRSYANSDIPDDVTITSDVSELTIDSFHTFNSGMTPTSRGMTSPNNPDLTMVSQMSDITLDSFQSCRLSDDEVTLTSKSSNTPEPPFAVDSTPNKRPPVRNGASAGGVHWGAKRPQVPPPGVPNPQQTNPQLMLQSEENAPPVPPRKDLQGQNQAPPIPVRPPLYSDAPAMPQPRPPGRSVTFADDHNQELHVGAPVARVKEARTVPLPRTDPQWSPGAAMNPALAQLAEPEGKKSKKKKKSEKKSKKTLLPYVGTTPEHGKAVRMHAGNGNGHPPSQGGQPMRNSGPQSDPMHSNNNTTVADARKEIVQNYIDSIAPQSGMRMPPHTVNQQVYTVHAQSQQPHMDERQISMRVDPRVQGSTLPNDHSKPHAYVQPYMRGGRGGGAPWMDNQNSNNGNLLPGDLQGAKRDSETYPFKGGNGNGIVLVEQPYVPTTENNANIAPFQPPLTARPQGHPGAGNLGPSSRSHVTMPRMGTRSPRSSPRLDRARRDVTDGRPGDRSSIASQDRAFYVTGTGARDTAV